MIPGDLHPWMHQLAAGSRLNWNIPSIVPYPRGTDRCKTLSEIVVMFILRTEQVSVPDPMVGPGGVKPTSR